MRIANRQQLLGIIAIAAVAFWAGDKLVLSPLSQSWKTRSERITKLRTDYKNGSRRLAWETSIRSEWDQMRTNALSPDQSIAENQVLMAFARWSRDTGVSIRSVTPQPKRNADDYMTLVCTVDAAGSLSALTRFLYLIESDPMALKVDMVRLNSRDSTGQQLELALQVSGLLLTPSRR